MPLRRLSSDSRSAFGGTAESIGIAPRLRRFDRRSTACNGISQVRWARTRRCRQTAQAGGQPSRPPGRVDGGRLSGETRVSGSWRGRAQSSNGGRAPTSDFGPHSKMYAPTVPLIQKGSTLGARFVVLALLAALSGAVGACGGAGEATARDDCLALVAATADGSSASRHESEVKCNTINDATAQQVLAAAKERCFHFADIAWNSDGVPSQLARDEARDACNEALD